MDPEGGFWPARTLSTPSSVRLGRLEKKEGTAKDWRVTLPDIPSAEAAIRTFPRKQQADWKIRPSVSSTLVLWVAEVVRLQRTRTLTSSATPKSSVEGALGGRREPEAKLDLLDRPL